MRKLRTLEEANEVTAIRLTEKRQKPKVGDLFRLSPSQGVCLWGRLIKRAPFFGLEADFNLVYIYDSIQCSRPEKSQLTPEHLLLGPSIVNNLGWSRGYWEVVESFPVEASDVMSRHLFKKFKGVGGPSNYVVVDEAGHPVKGHLKSSKLSQSGFGSFNSVDWEVRGILEERGVDLRSPPKS